MNIKPHPEKEIPSKWSKYLRGKPAEEKHDYDTKFHLNIGPGRLSRWASYNIPRLSLILTLFFFLGHLGSLVIEKDVAALSFTGAISLPPVIIYGITKLWNT